MTFLAVTGGTIVDPEQGVAHGDLLIHNDRIVGAGSIAIPAGADIVDATGLHVMPGLVDLGVFAVERRACAAGGITRVALMPDQLPPLDDPGLVQRAALAARPQLWVHPIAAATRGLAGTDLAEYAMMQRAGARAVSTGRSWIADAGVMHRALAYASGLGMTMIAHAEDGGLTAHAVATAGETATRLGLPAAPALAEALAIARDIVLAELTDATIHFRQVTTRAGFQLIRAGKQRGAKVTCGISPAHLLLSDIAVSDFRTFACLSPPLRSEDDRQASLAALADGTVDVLCSAHDPRGAEAKRLPFADAEPGMAGAETLLTLGLGLLRDGTLTLERLAQITSRNPARLLGVDAGSLSPGSPADLCLFDIERPWRVEGSTFCSSAGNTPFDRLPVQGKVVRTIKGGRTISSA